MARTWITQKDYGGPSFVRFKARPERWVLKSERKASSSEGKRKALEQKGNKKNSCVRLTGHKDCEYPDREYLDWEHPD